MTVSVEGADYVVPLGEVSTQIRTVEAGWGRSMLVVDLLVDGEPVRRVTLSAEAKVEQQVYVATRALARGEVVGPSDVEVRRMEVDRPISPVTPGHVRTTRYVRAGDLLRERLVEPVPDIAAGARVELMVVGERVAVRVTGIAEQDGWIGESITVRNESSGALVRGRVVDPATVRVEMW